MMQRLAVWVIPYCLASGAWAGTDLPRPMLDLHVYGGPAQGRAGAMRLRITLAGDVRQAERAVRVGDLLLCSPAACYRARTAGHVSVANTADGKVALLADVWMPAETITRVAFSDVAGASVIGGYMPLEPALVLDEAFPARELMLAVRKERTGTGAAYVPVQWASMPFADDNELVHYLPSFATAARLAFGTTFTIPAGALDRARIFNLGIADTGACYPRVDILPRLALGKPAVLAVPALRSACAAPEAIFPVGPAPHGGAAPVQDPAAAGPPARAVLSRTGVVEPERFGP